MLPIHNHLHIHLLWPGAFGYDNVKAPEGENIITTTRSHGTKQVVEAIESCEPSEVIRAGGAGHKVSSIAQEHLYARIPLSTHNFIFINVLFQPRSIDGLGPFVTNKLLSQ